MGDVHRAPNNRLGRGLALKVPPQRLNADAADAYHERGSGQERWGKGLMDRGRVRLRRRAACAIFLRHGPVAQTDGAAVS